MENRQTLEMDNLLYRYFEGNVTAEEIKQVEEWIDLCEDNYVTAKQIHQICLTTDMEKILHSVDTERALTNVVSKITSKEKNILLMWMQRIAVVLFIPLLITVLIQAFYHEPQPVQMMQIKTNPGTTSTFTLPDGTSVSLNSESTISYPSAFDGDIRNVNLEGEAFFSVAKDKHKRFVVSTPYNTSIEVLGTVFNVEAFKKDSAVITTLIEGKVNFLCDKKETIKFITLNPGQKLIYKPNSKETKLLTTTGVSEVAWKDGMIVFSDTPLRQALRILEKYYNVEFAIKTTEYDKDSFTGTFKHQRLERIMEIFGISSKIRWRYINTMNSTQEKSIIEIY